MSFIKKIKNKFSEDYHSRNKYILAKLFVALLTLPNVFTCLRDVVLRILGQHIEGEISGRFVVIVIFVGLFVFLNGIIETIFLPSGKIENNMKTLPKTEAGKTAIVQYDLFDKISPSEAAMLLYGRAEVSNLLCVIYKWINEKKVDLYTENGVKYLKKNQDLNEDTPDYEKFLFTSIFENGSGLIVFSKSLLKRYSLEFNEMLVKWCRIMGYIDNNIKPRGINRLYVSKEDLSKNDSIEKRNPAIGCLLFVFLFPGFAIASNLGGIWEFMWIVLFLVILLSYTLNVTYYINLTEKGKEMVSKIKGYKYYLERCEEEQINNDLKESEFYSKHLPYAIALKLNWKIIDKLS